MRHLNPFEFAVADTLGNKRAAMIAYAGVSVLLAGVVVADFFYIGPSGGAYSPLNHFISELGWGTHSPMAWVFNSCLCGGSLMLLPLLRAVGRQLRTRLGRAAMVVGVCATLSGSMVGVLPMEILKPHLCVASLFFLGWFLSVSLFTLAFCLDHNGGMPRSVVVVGVAAAVLCAVFLSLPKSDLISFLKAPDTFPRPRFWWIAFMEWSVFASMCVWVVAVSSALWRRKPGTG